MQCQLRQGTKGKYCAWTEAWNNEFLYFKLIDNLNGLVKTADDGAVKQRSFIVFQIIAYHNLISHFTYWYTLICNSCQSKKAFLVTFRIVRYPLEFSSLPSITLLSLQHRIRMCNDNKNCTGDSEEHEVCISDSCPMWTDWSSWTQCTETCGTKGNRLRVRYS